MFAELKKSEKDIETESSIIQEMLDIVAKRDSLIVLLEEERLRLIFALIFINIHFTTLKTTC